MSSTAALLAGLAAGLAVAAQVGVVSLLVVETAVVAGTRAGVAAGMGVASADLLFAGMAAAAGGAVSATLSAHEAQIRLAAAACLAGIAMHGLLELRCAEAAGAVPDASPAAGEAGTYARFLAITALNPLTIASFAAIAASLSLDGPPAAAAFAVGAGSGSAAWHLALPLAAGHVRRRLTAAVRRRLALGGRLAVLAIAAHLALAV